MGLSIYDEQNPIQTQLVLNAASTTVMQTVYQATENPARIDAVLVTSNSASPHDVQLAIYRFGQTGPVGVATIPALAGSAGVPAVDLIALLAPPVIGGFNITQGGELHACVTVTLSGGDALTLTALGGTL